MTQIPETSTGRRRAGVRRIKKLNGKIDMTPMVDLGFLLITFFVITTELSRPSVVRLNMPTDGPPTTLGKSNALTILLGQDDKVYYYHGDWKEAVAKGEIYKTTLSVNDGIGKVIREKQQWLDIYSKKEKRDGLMLLIKPNKEASYQTIIKALDEATINAVKKYAVLSTSKEEAVWMSQQ
jgi:biopolymer transport protein ExbD